MHFLDHNSRFRIGKTPIQACFMRICNRIVKSSLGTSRQQVRESNIHKYNVAKMAKAKEINENHRQGAH